MRVGGVYRELLRAVEKHIGKTREKRHFKDFITEEFRKNPHLPDEVAAQKEMKLARDYTFLLNSVHHHKMAPKRGSDDIGWQHGIMLESRHNFKCNYCGFTGHGGGMHMIHINKGIGDIRELLFSYNIAVDRSDEMRKTLNRSAASVGLRLPNVYQP